MIPRPDNTQKPADISKAIELALGYNPNLAFADLSTVRMWVAEGCDMDTDILPALQAAMKKKRQQPIRTFSYFTNAVLTNRDKRLLQKQLPPERTQAEKDEIRAQNIRWHRDRGITTTSVGLQDFDWLDEYEKKNGRAEA